MSERTSPSPVGTSSLSLSRAEQWTLHHVLCDHLGQSDRPEYGMATGDAHATLRRAFETLDAGERTFTRTQLETMQALLARYHHRTTWWMVERPQLEGLLHRVSVALDET